VLPVPKDRIHEYEIPPEKGAEVGVSTSAFSAGRELLAVEALGFRA
jgi:hypothetical protein